MKTLLQFKGILKFIGCLIVKTSRLKKDSATFNPLLISIREFIPFQGVFVQNWTKFQPMIDVQTRFIRCHSQEC